MPLAYGAQQTSGAHAQLSQQQFSLAAAAIAASSNQNTPALPVQPHFFQFPPHQSTTQQSNNQLELSSFGPNNLMPRTDSTDEDNKEYLKQLNTLHYLKQLQQQQQNNSITSIKSETPNSTDRQSPENNCSSPKINGQSTNNSKLAKPQPVHHNNISNTNLITTSK